MWNSFLDIVYLYQDVFSLDFWFNVNPQNFSDWLRWLMVWSSFVLWIVFLELAFILFFWHGMKLKKLSPEVKRGFLGTTAAVAIVSALGMAGMASGVNVLILIGLFALLPLYFLAFFGVATVPMLLILGTAAAVKLRVNEWILAILLAGTVTLSFAIASLYSMDMFFDDPQASRFFQFHGAVKNTCLVDPAKQNCPKTLEEISYIEPKEYAQVIKQNQVLYQYHPETNTYTLLVRYGYRRAVIFDPRLPDNNDSQDFREVEIETIGRDHIKNPPNLPGLWKELPEWDKGVDNVQ